MKNQKGITLVALVVTIIILLILAGVSLSLVAGSRGMLKQADNAVSTSTLANVKEEAELAIMTSMTSYYEARYTTKDKTTKALYEYVADDINENAPVLSSKATLTAEKDDSKKTATMALTVGGKTYSATFDDDGNITDWAEETS